MNTAKSNTLITLSQTHILIAADLHCQKRTSSLTLCVKEEWTKYSALSNQPVKRLPIKSKSESLAEFKSRDLTEFQPRE